MSRHRQYRTWGIILLLVIILISPGLNRTNAANESFDPDRAIAHIVALSDGIGIREAGTPNEGRAAVYVASQFVAMGLDTRVQALPAYYIYSQNVIAVKAGLDPEAGVI